MTDLAGVTTYHNNLARDGANNQEYLLTTANVKQATFGKLFACTVDGAVYAQPLWVPNVNIGGGTHNVIVVATMHDSVYVFDADTNNCANPYWKKTLIPAGETFGASGDVESDDILPDIGILGTPVIDPATQTIYLVSKTKASGTTNYVQRLHALSLTTGAEAANSPLTIAATFPGTCEGGATNTFDALRENQRPGLALSNGMVYVAWASHGDKGTYHGWVLGYQTANLAAVPTVFNVTPNTASVGYCKGGIWMSGGAPAFDAAGNMYVITGNGAFDGVSGSATLPTDFSDSYIKLSTPNLGVLDYFTPKDQSLLDVDDKDVGASGTSVLIDGTGGGNFLVGSSKAGIIYVLNRDNMGKYNTSADSVHQEWTVSPSLARVFNAGILEQYALLFRRHLWQCCEPGSSVHLQHVERDVQHAGCVGNANGIRIFGFVAIDFGVIGDRQRNRVGYRPREEWPEHRGAGRRAGGAPRVRCHESRERVVEQFAECEARPGG